MHLVDIWLRRADQRRRKTASALAHRPVTPTPSPRHAFPHPSRFRTHLQLAMASHTFLPMFRRFLKLTVSGWVLRQSPALCRPLNGLRVASPLKVNFRRAMATEANGEYDLVVIGGGASLRPFLRRGSWRGGRDGGAVVVCAPFGWGSEG